MSPGHIRTVSDGRTTLFTGATLIFNLTEVISDVTSKFRTESTCDPAQDSNSSARMGGPWPELQCDVSSFDGGIRVRARLQRPDRYRFWNDKTYEPRIPRGAGLSYAAASFR